MSSFDMAKWVYALDVRAGTYHRETGRCRSGDEVRNEQVQVVEVDSDEDSETRRCS